MNTSTKQRRKGRWGLKLAVKKDAVSFALRVAGRQAFDYLNATSEWHDETERSKAKKQFGRIFEAVIREQEASRFLEDSAQRRTGPVVIGGHEGMPHYVRLALSKADLPGLTWPESHVIWIDVRTDSISVLTRAPGTSWNTLYPRFKLQRMP